MDWLRKGLIIRPSGHFGWNITHAQLPFAIRLKGDIYRVYYSGRNRENKSQVGYVEIDINYPQEILYVTEKPVVGLGSLGAFDDSGIFVHWIVDKGRKKYLYYTGWMEGKSVPYYSAIGLAASQDGGKTFQKISDAPVLGRNEIDPYLTLSPCVKVEDRIWKMWYASCVGWTIENEKLRPRYHIRYAESRDGIAWKRSGLVCIDFKDKNEWAIGRPCVKREDGIYKMWYSYSVTGYRIGYAESPDGKRWKRKDSMAKIEPSASGWDSTISYPFIFDHKGTRYMLYNGNSFGKDGIGLAVLTN
jgi:hypothetical protein